MHLERKDCVWVYESVRAPVTCRQSSRRCCHLERKDCVTLAACHNPATSNLLTDAHWHILLVLLRKLSLSVCTFACLQVTGAVESYGIHSSLTNFITFMRSTEHTLAAQSVVLVMYVTSYVTNCSLFFGFLSPSVAQNSLHSLSPCSSGTLSLVWTLTVQRCG